MANVRTIAWGGLAAVLVSAVAWLPLPAAGQQSLPGTAPVAPQPGLGVAPPSAATPVADPAASPFMSPMGQPGMSSGFVRTQDQIAKLARQYVQATKEDEKKDLRKKIADALGRQFDQSAERQQKELEDLEKQVADLRALLKKRHDARDAIIERRLDQVLQEAEGLGWGTHSAGPRPSYYVVPQTDQPAQRR